MTADAPAPGLWLIGLGPGDLEHMTSRAKSVARGCKKRYLEGYTAVLPAEQETLLKGVIGPWARLMRPSVEKPEKLLEEAREEPIALLVVGDPMQATMLSLRICRGQNAVFSPQHEQKHRFGDPVHSRKRSFRDPV